MRVWMQNPWCTFIKEETFRKDETSGKMRRCLSHREIRDHFRYRNNMSWKWELSEKHFRELEEFRYRWDIRLKTESVTGLRKGVDTGHVEFRVLMGQPDGYVVWSPSGDVWVKQGSQVLNVAAVVYTIRVGMTIQEDGWHAYCIYHTKQRVF